MATAEKSLAHLAGAEAKDFPPTSREIAEAVGIAPSTATSALKKLWNAGHLKKRGISSDGSATWGLAEEN